MRTITINFAEIRYFQPIRFFVLSCSRIRFSNRWVPSGPHPEDPPEFVIAFENPSKKRSCCAFNKILRDSVPFFVAARNHTLLRFGAHSWKEKYGFRVVFVSGIPFSHDYNHRTRKRSSTTVSATGSRSRAICHRSDTTNHGF